METKPDAPRVPNSRGAYVGAAILIVIGVIALIANLTETAFAAAAIPLAIATTFLVAYAATRQYGFLVPAGVIGGFGAGALIESVLNLTDGGAYIVLLGGAGFLFIYVVDVLVTRSPARWWPLIPGGILALAGTGIASQSEGLLRQIGIWSPALLIVIGLLLLFMRPRSERKA